MNFMEGYLAKSDGITLKAHTDSVMCQMREYLSIYHDSIERLLSIDLSDALLEAARYHDLGKIFPDFQNMLKGGKLCGERHEVISALLYICLRPEDYNADTLMAVLTHHKNYYGHRGELKERYFNSGIERFDELYDLLQPALREIDAFADISKEDFLASADTLLREAKKTMNGFIHQRGRGRKDEINRDAVIKGFILKGLATSSDHLASAGPGFRRLEAGISGYKEMKGRLFNDLISAYPFQERAGRSEGSSLFIAPTGSGKTEAALLWASNQREIMKTKGRSFFILPYRASMNAMSDRLCEKLGDEYCALVHSSSFLRAFETLSESGISDSFETAKAADNLARMNVSPLKICSPFQLIKIFFAQNGYEAGLVSMIESQIIFDEIHAYDIDVTSLTLASAKYFSEWLNASILFMSATLPTHLKDILIKHFSIVDENIIYPTTDWLAEKKRHRLILRNTSIDDPRIIEEIIERSKGGSILVVVNQVDRAVGLFNLIKKFNKNSILLHSRFHQKDRNEIEKRLKPEKGKILIATQVVEVSLDIDYNELFTEIAPFESLLQRFGRINRYMLRAPENVNVFASFCFGDGKKNKYLPYKKDHILQVKEILDQTNGKVISELDNQELLDKTYPAELKRRLNETLDNRINDLTQYVTDNLAPYGLKDYELNNKLNEQWEELFDSTVVISENFFDADKSYFDLRRFEVSISKNKFIHYKNEGKIIYNSDKKMHIAKLPYSEVGLEL